MGRVPRICAGSTVWPAAPFSPSNKAFTKAVNPTWQSFLPRGREHDTLTEALLRSAGGKRIQPTSLDGDVGWGNVKQLFEETGIVVCLRCVRHRAVMSLRRKRKRKRKRSLSNVSK